MAIESLVSINSLSIFAIRITMSSTSQSSYFRGRTLGGPWFGLDRFGELGALETTTDADPSVAEVIVSCIDLRLFEGERGFVA